MSHFPFEVDFNEIRANPDPYISKIFASLESDFLALPKGAGFIEYPVFERGYEALKKSTQGFTNISVDKIYEAATNIPISVIVLRSILGFTPPEWAYITSQRTGEVISQGSARSLDRRIRMEPLNPLSNRENETRKRLKLMIIVACQLINEGIPEIEEGKIHRLDKADTSNRFEGVRSMADIGVPYAMLLYERFLGRPFAGHRDSVSEIIGDRLEAPIEAILTQAGISFHKTMRAEKVQGFNQAPDFIIPDEFNPQVIIEAKITEDDGTARDKVARIQNLYSQSIEGQRDGPQKYEVIACIGGRGFGVRRNLMKDLLYATKGKVFTLSTLDYLIENTRLKEYKTR